MAVCVCVAVAVCQTQDPRGWSAGHQRRWTDAPFAGNTLAQSWKFALKKKTKNPEKIRIKTTKKKRDEKKREGKEETGRERKGEEKEGRRKKRWEGNE